MRPAITVTSSFASNKIATTSFVREALLKKDFWDLDNAWLNDALTLKKLRAIGLSDSFLDSFRYNTPAPKSIDPVARHELLLTGELGVMYGCTITSDAYR